MYAMAFALAATLAAVPAAGSAQSQCQDNETITDCMVRLARPHVKEQASAQTDAQVRATPTGAGAKAGPASSSTNDFLSLFSAFLQSASLDSKKQELLLTFTPTAFRKRPAPFDPQLQWIIHQPQLFKDLKDELTAAGKTGRADDLQSSLNDLNDFEVVGSASLNTCGFGRHFASYRKYYEPLAEAAYDTTIFAPPAPRAFDDAEKLAQTLSSKQHLPAGEKLLIMKLGAQDRQAVEAQVTSSAALLSVENTALGEALKDLSLFADLVSNQPQLTLSLSYRHRAELVGPREWTVDLEGEYGFTRLSDYTNQRPSDAVDKDGQVKDAKPLLTNWHDYAEKHRGAIKAERRLKISAQYYHLMRYSHTVTPEAISVMLPVANRASASATYGQALLFDKDDKAIGRIDAQVQWENFSDDPAHKDRLVGSVTYTQKVSDTFSLPLGIAYANHGSFLDNVQKRFSAHFGLRMKIDWPKSDSSGGGS